METPSRSDAELEAAPLRQAPGLREGTAAEQRAITGDALQVAKGRACTTDQNP